MRGELNVIYIEAPNGDALTLVVGGDETVLGFTYGSAAKEFVETGSLPTCVSWAEI